MSQSIDDGGGAFPAMLPGGNYCTPGMSLLDWFAGQALQGLLASEDGGTYSHAESAEFAYGSAIAMLNVRERLNATGEVK